MNLRTKLLNEPARTRVNKRRMAWLQDDMNVITLTKFPLGNSRKILLGWIDTHTTSNFYMGGNKIAFTDEKDELIFRLKFDVR